MMENEILQEIYKIREAHAKAFKFDLKAICKDLRHQQNQTTHPLITQPLKLKV